MIQRCSDTIAGEKTGLCRLAAGGLVGVVDACRRRYYRRRRTHSHMGASGIASKPHVIIIVAGGLREGGGQRAV